MRVDVLGLAWWVERDGWKRTRTLTDGTDVYSSRDGRTTVQVPPDLQPDLDAARDRVYTQMRDRSLRHLGGTK